MTDTARLYDAIKRNGLKISFVCETLGLSREGLRRKANNINEFTASEITMLQKLLKLSNKERDLIFLMER